MRYAVEIIALDRFEPHEARQVLAECMPGEDAELSRGIIAAQVRRCIGLGEPALVRLAHRGVPVDALHAAVERVVAGAIENSGNAADRAAPRLVAQRLECQLIVQCREPSRLRVGSAASRHRRRIELVDTIDILYEPAAIRLECAGEIHRRQVRPAASEEMQLTVRAVAEEPGHDDHGKFM